MLPQLQPLPVFPAFPPPITNVSNTPHLGNNRSIASFDVTNIQPIPNPRAEIVFDTIRMGFVDDFFQNPLPNSFDTRSSTANTEHLFTQMHKSEEWMMS